MATQIPPPQAPQKSNKAGWGCLGCGCVVVVVIFLLIAGLIGGGIYMVDKGLNVMSSPTAAAIPPFTGGDDVFDSAQKKITQFNQDLSASKTSTLTLTSDEVNAVLNHDIDLKKSQAELLITLTGDQARVQTSVASNAIPVANWVVKDRYFNLDGTTGLSFDPDSKQITFDFHKLQVGEVTIPNNALQTYQTLCAQIMNQKLRENAAMANVLQNAKSVSIKDGQFVIETK
jgi:tellurite resistance protein